MTKLSAWIVVAVSGLAIALVAAPAGVAKSPGVRVAGVCTASSTSKLKLKGEDGRIEVEFEVDQNRNGVRWNVVLLQNGRRIARMARVTRAPSGSFTVRKLAADTSATDRFTARATSPSHEVCTARASI